MSSQFLLNFSIVDLQGMLRYLPIHAGKRRRYKSRKFGFLYHGTLSSATIRVKIGSEVPSIMVADCEAYSYFLGSVILIRNTRTEATDNQTRSRCGFPRYIISIYSDSSRYRNCGNGISPRTLKIAGIIRIGRQGGLKSWDRPIRNLLTWVATIDTQ